LRFTIYDLRWTRKQTRAAARCGFPGALIRENFCRNCENAGSMTTANKITILRILLVPFFVVEILYYVETGNELHRLLGLLAFAVAAILDGVDGYVARRYNQRSELGTMLDPLADKLLLVSGIVVLSFDHAPRLGQIPLWLTGTIIGRDLLILLGVAVIRFTVGKIVVRPRFIGKIATVLQMAVVIWILLKWDFGHGVLWLKYVTLGAAICTGVSGLLYVFDGVKQLGSHPASSPTKN
jgi:CDP-diacylglycerol--glycerol-3-phosphate 3-phosphatidyltransferase